MLVEDIRHPEMQFHSLQKEVVQSIKDKKRDKRVRDRDPSWGVGGVVKEKFLNSRKPSHRQVCGEIWNLRGQHNWEEKKEKIHRVGT